MWDHLEFSGWLFGRFLIKGTVVEKLPSCGVLHAPQKGNKWNVVCRERSKKREEQIRTATIRKAKTTKETQSKEKKSQGQKRKGKDRKKRKDQTSREKGS